MPWRSATRCVPKRSGPTCWAAASRTCLRTGRTCPDLDATLFFDPDEIQGAYLLTKKKPPNRPPRLNEVLRLIATLGGFLARKGDGEPGVKTIWLGLQRVMDAATTIQVLRNPAAMGCV